jgi:fumarate hydratase, class II
MHRTERDSLGEVQVPQECLWGAQTQRSLHFFAIGEERMPHPLIEALLCVKRAAAQANGELGRLPDDQSALIVSICDELLAGKRGHPFPLSVWQTGSGTQSNMNVNEVIANLANERLGRPRGTYAPIHPNDQVNASQSTNDVFPTAIHLATLRQLHQRLLPALTELTEALQQKAIEWASLTKVGRTHLMDAVPLTLGQEFSGYAQQLANGNECMVHAQKRLFELPIGGTAVGTGLNSPPQFGARVAALLAQETGLPLISAPNKFEALAARDGCVEFHSSLRRLAVSLTKIANDIRWMGSGPRAGLTELLLPANEPGSSIMPGKVNPTQCEALLMVCIQVMANDTAIGMAGAAGNFELNINMPLIAYLLLQSIRLLSDSMRSLARHCIAHLQPNIPHLAQQLENSLTLATSLAPRLGYERTAHLVQRAYRDNTSLRDANRQLGYLSDEEFTRLTQSD